MPMVYLARKLNRVNATLVYALELRYLMMARIQHFNIRYQKGS
jgi:hypothetical protein